MKIIVSRPAWARGLKQYHRSQSGQLDESRPAWARGLKPEKHCGVLSA